MTRRLARHYEHHSPTKMPARQSSAPSSCANYCFVFDHWDVRISLARPLPRSKLHLSYTFYLGENPVRQAGWSVWWQRTSLVSGKSPEAERVTLKYPFLERFERDIVGEENSRALQ